LTNQVRRETSKIKVGLEIKSKYSAGLQHPSSNTPEVSFFRKKAIKWFFLSPKKPFYGFLLSESGFLLSFLAF